MKSYTIHLRMLLLILVLSTLFCFVAAQDAVATTERTISNADHAQEVQITHILQKGMSGAEVATVQKYLVQKGYMEASDVTGYYGQHTEAAVQKYQCTSMEICAGSASVNGYGIVGPKTKARLVSEFALSPTATVPLAQGEAITSPAPTTQTALVTTTNAREALVVLVSGQSNVARETVNYIDDCTATTCLWERSPNLYYWNYQSEGAKTLPGSDFVRADELGVEHTSVAASFGSELAKQNPEKDVYVINVSDGGESIDRWLPGNTTAPDMHSILEREVTQALTHIPGKTKVDVFLWWQGEADSLTYKTYERRFKTLTTWLESTSWFPVGTKRLVFGLNSSTRERILTTEVLNLISNKDINTSFVDTSVLRFRDVSHLNVADRVEAGRRAYEVYTDTLLSNSNDQRRKLDLEIIASSLRKYFSDTATYVVPGGLKKEGRGWFSYECIVSATTSCSYPIAVSRVLHTKGYATRNISDPTGEKLTSDESGNDQSGYMLHATAKGFTLWANLDAPSAMDTKTLGSCMFSNYDPDVYSSNGNIPPQRRMNYCIDSI